jgi:hypothetical protein
MKSTFGKAAPVADQPPKQASKAPMRKEKIVVWSKKTDAGEEFLSIKINDVNGETLHLRAYKKKDKKSEGMPDYVGYERTDNAGTN